MDDRYNFRLVDNFGNASNLFDVTEDYAKQMAKEYLRLSNICNSSIYKFFVWKKLPLSTKFSYVCEFEVTKRSNI